MPEGKASVDVFWRSKEGLEMHLQLSGTSSVEVLSEADSAVKRIIDNGGEARPYRDPNGGEQVYTKDNPPKCSVCGKKMTYREGEGRNGKPYKGFFCPDRDCEGKPVWLDSQVGDIRSGESCEAFVLTVLPHSILKGGRICSKVFVVPTAEARSASPTAWNTQRRTRRSAASSTPSCPAWLAT